MTYVFHPAAETEHLGTIAYYEAKNPGLGALYLEDFEFVLRVICESPHRYRVERPPDVRRMRMTKFPFSVLYRESSGIVQVLAVGHHRRRPQYWIDRL